jgi:hypothetical protein
MINEIDEMKSRYPYRDRTKEQATLAGPFAGGASPLSRYGLGKAGPPGIPAEDR